MEFTALEREYLRKRNEATEYAEFRQRLQTLPCGTTFIKGSDNIIWDQQLIQDMPYPFPNCHYPTKETPSTRKEVESIMAVTPDEELVALYRAIKLTGPKCFFEEHYVYVMETRERFAKLLKMAHDVPHHPYGGLTISNLPTL